MSQAFKSRGGKKEEVKSDDQYFFYKEERQSHLLRVRVRLMPLESSFQKV